MYWTTKLNHHCMNADHEFILNSIKLFPWSIILSLAYWPLTWTWHLQSYVDEMDFIAYSAETWSWMQLFTSSNPSQLYIVQYIIYILHMCLYCKSSAPKIGKGLVVGSIVLLSNSCPKQHSFIIITNCMRKEGVLTAAASECSQRQEHKDLLIWRSHVSIYKKIH